MQTVSENGRCKGSHRKKSNYKQARRETRVNRDRAALNRARGSLIRTERLVAAKAASVKSHQKCVQGRGCSVDRMMGWLNWSMRLVPVRRVGMWHCAACPEIPHPKQQQQQQQDTTRYVGHVSVKRNFPVLQTT